MTGSYWVNLGLLGAGGSISLDGKVIAQSRQVRLRVPLRQLQYRDTAASSWRTASGQRPFYVAGSERSIQLTANVTVNGA